MTNPAPQHHHDQNPGRIIQKPAYLVRAIDAREEAWAELDELVDERASSTNEEYREQMQSKIERQEEWGLFADRKLNAAEDCWESQKADTAWQCNHPAELREFMTDISQSFTGGSYDDTQTDTVICGVCGAVIEEK